MPMKKLSTFFNYIYFRLAKVYYKWDGEEADTATHGLSTFFFGIMIDLMIFFRVWLYGFESFNIEKIYLVIFAIGSYFTIYYMVQYKYKNFHIQENKWSNIPKDKARLHTILIYAIGIFIVLGIPMLVLGNWWSWHK